MKMFDINYLSDYKMNSGDAFLDKIHEDGILDINLFNQLLNDICLISKFESECITRNYELVLKFIEKCYSIQSFFSRCLISHYNPLDSYKIKNIESLININKEPRLVFILKERLDFLIIAYMKNDYESILDYEDELGKLVE